MVNKEDAKYYYNYHRAIEHLGEQPLKQVQLKIYGVYLSTGEVICQNRYCR